MPGHQDTLDFDAVDVQDLPVRKQHTLVVRLHHRQRIQLVDDPAPRFAGEIAVFNLAQVDRGVFEEQLAVPLQCAHVVRVLMGDEDMPDGGRIHVQPAHLLPQPPIVVTGVDHDGHAVLRIEENIGDPLSHAGHTVKMALPRNSLLMDFFWFSESFRAIGPPPHFLPVSSAEPLSAIQPASDFFMYFPSVVSISSTR